MKLILMESVSGLGGPGDVVETKDGYARNYLFPRRLAIPWTRGGEKQIAGIRRARRAREIRDLGHAKEVRDELESLRIRLSVRTGQSGKLFGSVTVADVVGAVSAGGGPSLDKRAVAMPRPIRELGSHRLEIRLHPEVVAVIDVEVVAA